MAELYRTRGERDPLTRRPIYDAETAAAIAKPTSDPPLTASGERGGPTLGDFDGDEANAAWAAHATDPTAAAEAAGVAVPSSLAATGEPSATITEGDGEVVIAYSNPTGSPVEFERVIGGRTSSRTIGAGEDVEATYKRDAGDAVEVRVAGSVVASVGG